MNQNFLSLLKNFDKQNVSSKTLFKLKEKVFDDPSINYQAMKCKSMASASLYLWLKGVYDFCLARKKSTVKHTKIEEKPEIR